MLTIDSYWEFHTVQLFEHGPCKMIAPVLDEIAEVDRVRADALRAFEAFLQ